MDGKLTNVLSYFYDCYYLDLTVQTVIIHNRTKYTVINHARSKCLYADSSGDFETRSQTLDCNCSCIVCSHTAARVHCHSFSLVSGELLVPDIKPEQGSTATPSSVETRLISKPCLWPIFGPSQETTPLHCHDSSNVQIQTTLQPRFVLYL